MNEMKITLIEISSNLSISKEELSKEYIYSKFINILYCHHWFLMYDTNTNVLTNHTNNSNNSNSTITNCIFGNWDDSSNNNIHSSISIHDKYSYMRILKQIHVEKLIIDKGNGICHFIVTTLSSIYNTVWIYII